MRCANRLNLGCPDARRIADNINFLSENLKFPVTAPDLSIDAQKRNGAVIFQEVLA